MVLSDECRYEIRDTAMVFVSLGSGKREVTATNYPLAAREMAVINTHEYNAR